MGCGISQTSRNTVPIGNSLIHLLQTNQNDQIIKRIQQEKPAIFTYKLNFRGDTIMHYVCSKNNVQVVEYLKRVGANFQIKNNRDKLPVDLTSDEEIRKLISNGEITIESQPATLKTKAQSPLQGNKNQQKYQDVQQNPQNETTKQDQIVPVNFCSLSNTILKNKNIERQKLPIQA